MTGWRIAAALVAGVVLFWALAEPAPPVLEGPLDVGRLPARLALERSVEVFDDHGASAQLDDVRGRHAERFRRNVETELARGYATGAVWVRLHTRNSSAQPLRWVLEVDEPTLDDVALYVVRGDGHVETYRTGDMRPFAERDVVSSNFAFYLSALPGEETTCFLRVASLDSLNIPLAAYRPNDWFIKHERESLFSSLLYGALLAVSLYYLSVFATVHQIEYVWCALINFALLVVQAGLYGHVSQYVLPGHPQLANRVGYVAIASAMTGVAVFARISLRRIEIRPKIDEMVGKAIRATLGVIAFALLAPKGLAIRGLCVLLLAICAVGPLLVRVLDTRRFPELRLMKICWLALICTVPVAMLRQADLLPRHPLLELALPLGILAHGGAMSLGLAYWVAQMRVRMTDLNTALSDNVSNLKIALRQGEEARQRAERATMAKDDFMATMSHELRTPLNAIINIPQGMIGDFETTRSAQCVSCRAEYLLDADEQVSPDTVCEECQSKGPWILGPKVRFVGDAARSLHFMKKIERSGQHLLQMVNGVLDYSKLEAGRFQLSLEPADLESLCREVVEQMSDLGSARNIELVFRSQSEAPEMTFDPLRIRQVLINLLANAIKFSEPNNMVEVVLRRDGDAAIIEVHDAGIGIAPENHERIFTGFEQVHKGDTRKYGGTGLGLSISRSLVRMHGGELSVRSELGQGATFVVRLPRLPKLGADLGASELKVLAQRISATGRGA